MRGGGAKKETEIKMTVKVTEQEWFDGTLLEMALR